MEFLFTSIKEKEIWVIKRKQLSLPLLQLLLALLYIFYDLTGNIGYILPRRTIKVVAIVLTGGAIAFSNRFSDDYE